uniref:TATA-binding protein-associated factor BTAF1 n=1 Tax=Kalanchoe fedtschenkoi TaxID=63787 RepID=A0A7N0U9X5_KALFE
MAQQQSSRLHRLLTLLDTGSNQTTRLTAARQIGEIARSHPQDLSSLLRKVSQYLHSKNWDTRVAAAQAIGAIAENVKCTSLSELYRLAQNKMSEAGCSPDTENVLEGSSFDAEILSSNSFKSFDINKVLEFGSLVASGGQEYDISTDSSKNPRDRLARQKQNLRRRLGLDVCEQFMDVNDMIKDEDLVEHKFNSESNGTGHRYFIQQQAQSIRKRVARIVPGFISKRPSARELNKLKRKAKVKDQLKNWSEDGEMGVTSPRMATTSKGSPPDSSISSKVSIESDIDGDNLDNDKDGGWPFQNFVEQLILDMFDPIWETRHGSVMALREILTHQGSCAAVFMPDVVSDGVMCPSSKDTDEKVLVKRERDIDLNMQVSVNESESSFKRPKLEDDSQSLTHTSSINGNLNLNKPVTVEDIGSLSIMHDNGALDINSPQMEAESYLSEALGFHNAPADREDSLAYFDEKLHVEKLSAPKDISQNAEVTQWFTLARHSWLRNCEFLQDCAIRLLCVLSLDRFGDYVSDQVVAPVRETCAQALGVLLKYMHPLLVLETLKILLQMQHRPEWEIRHGSLLGIKYLVAVRQEMLNDLLGCIIPACKTGLEDPDDDVRAVAADALIPTSAALVSLKGETLQNIIMLLWDILLDLDDLSPSTSSVMNLLSEIYSQNGMVPSNFDAVTLDRKQNFDLNDSIGADFQSDAMRSPDNPYLLSTLAPRLWPFMRHNITTVRFSAIRTLERLLEAQYKRSIMENSTSSFWPSFIFGDTLRMVYQNLLLESHEEILQCSERVWRILMQCPVEDLESAARLYLSSWLELATTPVGSTLDTAKMFWPVALPRKSHFKAAAKMRAVMLENDGYRKYGADSTKEDSIPEKNGEAAGNNCKIIVGADLEMSITRTRVVTAAALGVFASVLRDGSLRHVIDPLWNALSSSSGVQRQVASLVIISWFKEIRIQANNTDSRSVPSFPDHFKHRLLNLLACTDPSFPTEGSRLPYTELSRTYNKMRSEASQLLLGLKSSELFACVLSNVNIDLESLSVDDAINFASKLSLPSCDNLDTDSSERRTLNDFESLRHRLLTTSGYLKCVQGNLHISVSSLVAAAVVWTSKLPEKLNPVIPPLMASIKREQEEALQLKAAESLAELISHCIGSRPAAVEKIIKNICSLICSDPIETPQAALICADEVTDNLDQFVFGNSIGKQKAKVNLISGGEDRLRGEGYISRRGSELALKQVCGKFGPSLFEKVPRIWDCLTEVLKPCSHEGPVPLDEKKSSLALESFKDPQMLINNIQLVRSITPVLDESLRDQLLSLLPCIFKCVSHLHVAVRLAASKCITSMAISTTTSVMGAVLETIVPMLGDTNSAFARQGAGMLVGLLVQGLGVKLVPYAPYLVVPLLKCMGDCDNSVRQTVTRSFAALVPLLPLARGLPPPDGINEGLCQNTKDVQFLEQLLDSSHIDDYVLHTELKVILRRYQQEGINWLAFLKRFKLHGILCDDMGLGKTLQASAIVASDVAEHRSSNAVEVLPSSLIVCPSTLVGHWAYEIDKYIDSSIMTTLQYAGSAEDRASLRGQFDKHNVIITSYDVVRKDIDYLGKLPWNYCILDEGHIIKNSKSKITLAVKQLKAQHRLVLSGTPIQNNVLDLWSLFDFLMPGFLGTERQFQATYGKPLVAARDSKCSAKDAEAGALAMEALHKQVMPFLLRRTKDEVLSDLPEKIIQDRYCDLSPVQLKLYEKFSGSHVRHEISSLVKKNESLDKEPSSAPKASSHVFQALQYLLKLCSHPLLVIGDKIPDTLMSVLSGVFASGSDVVSELHKIHHSPKLVALQEILEECGIGVDTASSEGPVTIGHHRVLIFAQHKAFLDLIEKDLFQANMRSVTYLRLDGSVDPGKRFEIVKAFNSDPTIDVLLLTTHVGGLGLNLTSADTLVFVEHDWNPMRDLQAMDRAHRLGQRKVVNVHRLIMRGTLEEKVMNLQKFKVSVANTVINSENASMNTMNTDQLLDLFTSAKTSNKGANVAAEADCKSGDNPKGPTGKKGLKAILGGLEDLWDQSQYTEEYNLNQFLAKLNG